MYISQKSSFIFFHFLHTSLSLSLSQYFVLLFFPPILFHRLTGPESIILGKSGSVDVDAAVVFVSASSQT